MRKYLLFILPVIFLASCMEKEDHRIDLSYSKEQLRFINAPVGGLGTGNILISGYGNIREIEIFNRPAMDELPPEMTFFALYTKADTGSPVCRIMEGEQLGEYPNPFGKPRQQLGGLPRFSEAVFHNAYPAIRIDLVDQEVPLDVTMHAWSPYIPTDVENSSIPSAIIEWQLFNPGKEKIEYSIAFSMGDPLEETGDAKVNHILKPISMDQWLGFSFEHRETGEKYPGTGQFQVHSPMGSNLSLPRSRSGWWDDAHQFWNEFSADGILRSIADSVSYSKGSFYSAGMNISGELQPGEEISIPFLLTWFVPWRTLESNMSFGNENVDGAVVKNYYSTKFNSGEDVSAYIIRNMDRLRSATLDFSHAMITSSVPPYVLDAAISNLAPLKTNLVMRDEEGNFHGYEGLGNNFGCCPGNCTHVWNYAQTMAAVFPSLERNVRETSFTNATHENGYQCFRTVFPLSENWFKNVAADGQMGNIMRVYREWKMSGNDEWLGKIWPNVKSALEFAWKGKGDLADKYEWMNNHPVAWDPYKEGVLRGDQHNTYDINFFGPNMMTGSLYLGALKACSEMADAVNEPQKSVEYALLYEKGRQAYRKLLWNGEYFIQDVEVIDGLEVPARLISGDTINGQSIPKYQYGNGCLSDQLLGQYLAFLSGMGYIMDTADTRSALESIYRYNYRDEMRQFDNVQRIYAANNEPGLVLCSWPNNDKPELPFVYSDEVWTGVEYQVATSMIFAGLLDEGLEITSAVRSRYDGSNRNPFAEIESGRYYARAMASWGVYQAMAGYTYDAHNGLMRFAPAVDALPHRYFWSTGTGWGTIEISRAHLILKCMYGSVSLQKLVLEGRKFFTFREFVSSYEADISYEDEVLEIELSGILNIDAGDSFRMDIP